MKKGKEIKQRKERNRRRTNLNPKENTKLLHLSATALETNKKQGELAR
jgi:hypothetical protein